MAPTGCRHRIMSRSTALRTIDFVRNEEKRIPGFWLGILFFLAAMPSIASPLAWELFKEGNWPACSIEAARILASDPANESARFLLNASTARVSPTPETCSNLLALSRTAACPGIRSLAAAASARMLLHGPDPASAWEPAVQAFLSTPDPDAFLQGLAIMQYLARHNGSAIRMPAELEQQYLTCRPLLRHLTDDPRPPRPDSLARRIGTAPGRLTVAFYRRCIRPALGERCVLSPSCSEYFLQATGKHGLMAIPMLADRLVREPSVVATARYPLAKGRRIVYHDPVEHHDFWMDTLK